MPTTNQHLNWAEQNEQFAKSLQLSDPVQADWAITAIFYAALHYVDGYFVARGTRPIDHSQRDAKIRDTPQTAGIWQDYKRLKDMSREARYNLAPYAQIEFDKALKHLERVRSQVLAYLPT